MSEFRIVTMSFGTLVDLSYNKIESNWQRCCQARVKKKTKKIDIKCILQLCPHTKTIRPRHGYSMITKRGQIPMGGEEDEGADFLPKDSMMRR